MENFSTGASYRHTSRTPHTHAYLGSVISSLCREYKAKRILDIGCGNGALANVLTKLPECELVVGCDPSETGIQIARETVLAGRFYQMGVYDDTGMIQETDFDVAVSTEVIEHLYSPRALPQFARDKLRDGGYLILSTPYHGYIKNLAISVLNKWDTHFTPLWDGGHIKFWSRRTLTKLLEEEGFSFERFIGCGRLPFLWMSMVIVARKV